MKHRIYILKFNNILCILSQIVSCTDFALAQVHMFHGADRATLLVICREGFDVSACHGDRIYFSNAR
jgi:hypothetical protein